MVDNVKLKVFIAFLILASPLFIFQNCGPGFNAVDMTDEINMSSEFGDPVLFAKGETLYKNNCLTCHGALSGFTYKNATAQQIQTAVEIKVPTMSSLRSVLRGEDYRALEEAVRSRQSLNPNLCRSSDQYTKTKIRRMNSREFTNSVRDLFTDASLQVGNYPQSTTDSGFDTNEDAVRTYNDDIPQLLALSEALISQLKQKSTSLINSCNSAGGGSATTKNASQVTCAKNLISQLAKKAYRKIPASTELTPLNAMIDSAGSVQDGLGVALGSMLLAPQFLFHMVDYSANRVGALHTLSAFELASRMSFFIWGTIPDDELLGLAENGQLLQTSVQSEQVKRMLKDPKAQDFPSRFAPAWLNLSKVNRVVRGPQNYPEFTPALKSAMINETILLFTDTYKRNLPVDAVLTASYTFLNKPLADLYKIPFTGQNPESFYPHMLGESLNRKGFLSHASIMTLTSSEAATSPVKRGHFLLDMVLCQPTEDPPPETAKILDQIDHNLPIRERLKIHSTVASCASCHKHMDPIGFAYENFDPIGRWRTHYTMLDGKQIPVDSSGVMPDGFQFTRPTEVPGWFASGDRFEKCMNRYLSVYAMGRLFGQGDMCAANANIDKLVRASQPVTFESMIESLVTSDMFKKSRVQE